VRGDIVRLPGWELTVRTVDRHTADQVRLVKLEETA
jgi:CBS domain containing-hemolysin-like protein